MLKSKTRWVVKEVDEGLKETLQNQLQLSPLLAQLLIARGMDTAEKATHFCKVRKKTSTTLFSFQIWIRPLNGQNRPLNMGSRF